jgi:hypothetical protein
MSRKVVMQRDPDEMGLFSLATFQTLRLEALDLFDRSLAESKAEYLERFLEQQVTKDPPPLELLSQIAEDIHQRLLALNQRHFDARDQIRRTFQHQYGLDLTPFLPSDPLEYHRLNLEEALSFFSQAQTHLSDEKQRALRELLQDELASAARLYIELVLAEQLYAYLMDWLMALHIVTVRGAWTDDPNLGERLTIH